MADARLLEDRKITAIIRRHTMGQPHGWDVTLSCGHTFWSPTDISRNLLMVCTHCVRKFAFDAKAEADATDRR